jgi:hypothetical protein
LRDEGETKTILHLKTLTDPGTKIGGAYSGNGVVAIGVVVIVVACARDATLLLLQKK